MDNFTVRKDSPNAPETVDYPDGANTGVGAEKTVRDERTSEPKEMLGDNKATPPTENTESAVQSRKPGEGVKTTTVKSETETEEDGK